MEERRINFRNGAGINIGYLNEIFSEASLSVTNANTVISDLNELISKVSSSANASYFTNYLAQHPSGSLEMDLCAEDIDAFNKILNPNKEVSQEEINKDWEKMILNGIEK